MQGKTLDLTFVQFCNGNVDVNVNTEISKRKAKTRKYLSKKEKRKREIISNLVVILLFAALIIGTCIKIYNTEPRYAIASETENYIYVTEKLCEVVNTSENITTVSYKGNEYDFYGNGFENGEKIICQFTDEMEIIGVIK